MCGRYQLVLPAEALRELFGVAADLVPYPPRVNIAPTQPVHVVRLDPSGDRRVDLMRWGFVPSFVKDPQSFRLIINARSESVVEKPSFRNAIRRRRALLPATGFYEWEATDTGKVPRLFTTLTDGSDLFALAGLFETWCGPNGEEVDTVAILTAAACGEAARFHDRMPLTVPPEAFADWLDPANDDGAAALALAERAQYASRPVSRRLGNARNEGLDLLIADEDRKAERESRAQAGAQLPLL